MPSLRVRLPDGRSRSITVPEGASIARTLKKESLLQHAAELGVQKKGKEDWEDVSILYVVQKGDVLRLKSAAGTSTQGQGLAAFLTSLFSSVRRKRVAPRDRRNKK